MIETAHLAGLSVALLIGLTDLSPSPSVEREKQAENTMDSVDQRVMEKFAEFEGKRDPRRYTRLWI